MAKKSTTIRVEGIIGGGWYGDGISSKEFKNQLERATGDVEVYINSGGGYVNDGIEMYLALKDYKRGDVTATIGASAASAATIVALGADKIVADTMSQFMIHEVSGGVIGRASEIFKVAGIIEKFNNVIAKLYVDRTGSSLKDIKNAMSEETYYFGNEILEAGFADDITDKGSDDKVMNENRLALVANRQGLNDMFEKRPEDWNLLEQHLNDLGSVEKNLDLVEEKPLPRNNKKSEREGEGFMSLKELIAQNPGVQAELDELVGKGSEMATKLERERCQAFVEAMESFPKATNIYLNAIKLGKSVNDVSVMSQVMALMSAGSEAAKNTEEDAKIPAGAPIGEPIGDGNKNVLDKGLVNIGKGATNVNPGQ